MQNIQTLIKRGQLQAPIQTQFQPRFPSAQMKIPPITHQPLSKATIPPCDVISSIILPATHKLYDKQPNYYQP